MPQQTTPIVVGGWSGTITFHGVINEFKDGPSEDDPTLSVHEETRLDVTDTFTVSGNDPEDMTYGIDLVNLAGSASNVGTTLERYVYTADTTNSLDCHYLDETGSEVSGPWSLNANAFGEIRFADDGSYSISMGAAGDPVTGESVPTPDLPKTLWGTITVLAGAAADCPTSLGEQDTTEGPIVAWASSYIGEVDVNSGLYSSVEGQLSAANPGSVVDGSITFNLSLPKMTLTVTWHLVHDGPIILPHE